MRFAFPTCSKIVVRCACAAALTVTMVACDSSTGTQTPNLIKSMGGDAQTVSANAAAKEPLSVQVSDIFGNPVRNAMVNWKVDSGSGSVSSVQTKTGLDGTASNTFSAGATTGDAVITATVGGIYVVTFTEHIGG